MSTADPGLISRARTHPAFLESGATTDGLAYHDSSALRDEDNETSSDIVEPVTPTSDGHPTAFFSQHHDGTVESRPTDPNARMAGKSISPDDVVGLQQPTKLTSKPEDAAPQSTSSSASTSRPSSKSDPNAPPRPKLGKLLGSFVKSKLNRANTNGSSNPATTIDTSSASSPTPEEFRNPPVAAPIPAPTSAPAEQNPQPPKPRRFSSWSLSVRNSPVSSNNNSPPSPGSPSSTINISDQQPESSAIPQRRAPSQSMPKPRAGVTWASNFRSGNLTPPRPARRRSASTELIPKIRPRKETDDATVGMIGTFSKHAVEGTGLKARRLSTSLPDEFYIDQCELDDEFKSTSLLPGRRGKLLGKGATAAVRLMNRKGGPADELFAVKEFRGKEANEDEDEYVKKVKSEYSIAKSLRHPNIVETVRLCTHSGRWNHVMEYCCGGELYGLVDKGLFKDHLKLEDRLCLFKQLLRGVDYLHSHGIAHRDIKLENLLLTGSGHLKITDFGVSEVFSGEHPGLRGSGGQCGKNMGDVRLCKPGICGSLPYIAPEVLAKEGEYDPRPLDVWSCAIVFLTMTYGGCPWQAAKVEQPHYAKFKKGWDDWLENHPDGVIKDEADGSPKCGPLFSRLETPGLKRLMLKMLHPLPEKRVGIREAVMLPTVKSIECCTAESYEEELGKCSINVADKLAATKKKAGAKLTVKKKHNHLPPKEHKLPKVLHHRFDMGDGWS